MPASAARKAEKPRQPLVPCCGHAFDENLVCRCRVSWWDHQRDQASCPMDARRHNGHGAHPPDPA